MTALRTVRPARMRAVAAASIGLLGLGLLAACGSDSNSSADPTPSSSSSAAPPASSSGSSAPSSSAPAANDPVATAQAVVDKAYAGTSTGPSTESRPAQKGKKVIIVAQGLDISTKVPVDGEVAAGQALGWDVEVKDGKSQPQLWPNLVRQAIAAKPDGIVLQAIDCPAVKAPLEEAKAAGIPVTAGYSFDCDDPGFGGGAPLFTKLAFFGAANGDIPEFNRKYAEVLGDYTVAKTGGKGTVIYFQDPTFRILAYTKEGFDRAIKRAPGMKQVDVEVTVVELLNGKGAPKIAQALLSNPDAVAVKAAYTFQSLTVAQETVKANKTDQILNLGSEGFAPELDLIRTDKGVDAVNVVSSEWVGWAAMDAMNSIFLNQEPADAGLGWTLVDRDKGLPATPGAEFQDKVDFKAGYKKAWGVG